MASMNQYNRREYERYVAESLEKAVGAEYIVHDHTNYLEFKIPTHIKDLVEDTVFNYLDNRELEYIKAESSVASHEGKMVPCMIKYFDYPKRFQVTVPIDMAERGKITKTEFWNKVAHYLPNAAVSYLDQELEQRFEYMVGEQKDYTVLFKDFAEQMTQLPEHGMPLGMKPLYPPRELLFSVSCSFDIVHKSQNGITPDFIHSEINFK